MVDKTSRSEAREEIELFFRRRDFCPEEVRKIKKVAMRFRIRLADHKRRFCKRCLSKLDGLTKVSKAYKSVECQKCGFKNKFRLASSKP
ncbi:MAG: hypothetical protein ABH864_01350 [archaeon]